MIVSGDRDFFAIEAGISEVCPDSLIALGYFTIFVGGASFGLMERDATALGPAYRDARSRLSNAGRHGFAYSSEPDGRKLICAIESALNDEEGSGTTYYGVDGETFTAGIGESRIGWHWCCSQAFDDGSSVWHFDCGDQVRLIAENDRAFRDKVVPSSLFYGVLSEWVANFERELKLPRPNP